MLKLGQIEIRRLLEVTGPHALISEAFLEASPDALAPHRHWLEPDALCPVTQRMILPVQAYLLRTRHRWIVSEADAFMFRYVEAE